MRLRGDIALEDEAYRGRRTSRAAVFGEQAEEDEEEEDEDDGEGGFLGSDGDGEDEEEEEEQEADGRAAKRSRVAAGRWRCGGRGGNRRAGEGEGGKHH